MKKLFNTNQSRTVLARFTSRIDALSPEGDFDSQRNSLIRLVTHSMERESESWDESCQINIQWIGDSFISRISDEEKELDKKRLDDICSYCFRFLFELYLSIKNELAMEFESARRFVFKNIDQFEGRAKEQIEYAIKEMPISIFKQLSNSEAIDSLRNFSSTFEKAENLKLEWNQEIEAKQKKVDQLKVSLEKYENAYNFVGLYQGFDDLSVAKEKEKSNTLFWLRIIALLAVTPIIAELAFIYFNFNELAKLKEVVFLSMLPAFSLVVIGVYYFRVLLFNYKSINSQLIQINLRKTLCRFIQNYSNYSAEIKKSDSESLSKFENIIFSGIVVDSDKMPSTFDGIEQLGKLLESVKK